MPTKHEGKRSFLEPIRKAPALLGFGILVVLMTLGVCMSSVYLVLMEKSTAAPFIILLQGVFCVAVGAGAAYFLDRWTRQEVRLLEARHEALLGDVRHELKNVLIGMEVNTRVLSSYRTDPGLIRKMGVMSDAVRDAQGLIEQLRLEFREEDPEPVGIQADLPVTGAKFPDPRILLVDDQPEFGQLVRDLLGSAYSLELAPNAEAALGLIYSGQEFDSILIDLDLPDHKGDRLAQLIRDRDPHAVLILTTSWPLRNSDPRRAPFDVCLEKPFADRQAFLFTIAQTVPLTRTRRQEAKKSGSLTGPWEETRASWFG